MTTPDTAERCVKDQTEKTTKRLPLFPHQNGQWAKKIRGKLHNFGPWQAPEITEKEYLDIREYLQAGRRPPIRLASRQQIGRSDVEVERELVSEFRAA